MLSVLTQTTIATCVFGHASSFIALFFLSSTYRRLRLVDKYDWSNLVSSSIFQLWIIGSMLQTLMNTASHDVIASRITEHYHMLQGFFIYDVVYLATHGTKYTTFILHHMGCLYFIVWYLTHGYTSHWFNLLFPVLGEIANPFLSMRRILRETHGKSSILYRINRFIVLALYFECRILGFPIALIMHYPEIQGQPWNMWLPMYVVTGVLYTVSLGWFWRLLKS